MKLRIVAPAILLVALAIVLLPTLGFPFKSQLFPLVILFPLLALVGVQLFKELTIKEAEKEEATAGRHEQGMALFWIGVFLATVYLLGFLVGMPLFVLLYIKSHGVGWVKTTAFGVVALLVVEGFVWGMGQFAFYQGLLFEAFA